MRLGRAGGAAAPVAARRAAQQQYGIARLRLLADDVFRRGSAYHCADLHTLGFVARMIDFVHQAGGKADLVP